jgi:D-lyxose ketol-isomerase
MKYIKKYTNADFYTEGKFNERAAKEAYLDMFEFYGITFTKFMEENFWVADFGIGDFENVGMGGVTWVNDADNGYYASEMYLLPDQMIPEHAHVKTDFPPKFETWLVTKGWAYNFSEVGEATADPPLIPAGHGDIISKNYIIQGPGEIVHLKEAETFHFLMAGSEGAFIDEWASYHDGAGLRFTCPKASL